MRTLIGSIRLRAREGFALPIALLAMIVIGAVVTGGVYMSSQEQTIAVSTDLGAQALYAAEYGIGERLGTWRTADMDTIQPGQPYEFPVTNGTRQVGTYTIRVMPLGNGVFMVQSEGQVGGAARSARRRAATFVRTREAAMPHQTAMAVIGQLEAGGNSLISGYDQCSADGLPAVMAQDESYITGIQKNPNEDRIVGEPAVAVDSAMDADFLSTFGDVTLDDLIASATKHLQHAENPSNMVSSTTTVNGQTVCNTLDPNNWGEPIDEDHVCANYYPVIHVDGDLTLTTGKGQGILIVEGDLEIAGNFEFSGVVIVKGSFKMRGTGLGTGKINGSVIVQGDGDVETESTTSGNAQVHYNSCKVKEAFDAAVRIRQFASRAWLVDPSPMPTF